MKSKIWISLEKNYFIIYHKGRYGTELLISVFLIVKHTPERSGGSFLVAKHATKRSGGSFLVAKHATKRSSGPFLVVK